MRALLAIALPALCLLVPACGATSRTGTQYDFSLGDTDGSAESPDAGDGGAPLSCDPNAPDQSGCGCSDPSTSRACYPSSANPATRHVGACMDGTQICQAAGEFSAYGPCQGAVVPVAESCSNGIDDNCDGKVDCADPNCATNSACNTACANGATRACYDGPSGTLNVGTCVGGTQTCANNAWPSNCPGEVLPTSEDCTDALDHNCNNLPGCLNLFSCILSPACQGNCTTPDPGCVCPMGDGDTALCPDGYIGVDGGTLTNPTTECCPCTSGDCGNPGCCAESVCAGNSQCAGLVCQPLPSMCMGMVNADCDDFPEDCDEPCCKCTSCM